MFSSLYWIDLPKETLCCIRKHQPKSNWNLDLSWFRYELLEVHVWWFSNLSEYIWIFPIACTMSNEIWRRGPIPLKTSYVFMVFVLWSSSNHISIVCRCLIKKSKRVTPANLTLEHRSSIAWLYQFSIWATRERELVVTFIPLKSMHRKKSLFGVAIAYFFFYRKSTNCKALRPRIWVSWVLGFGQVEYSLAIVGGVTRSTRLWWVS